MPVYSVQTYMPNQLTAATAQNVWNQWTTTTPTSTVIWQFWIGDGTGSAMGALGGQQQLGSGQQQFGSLAVGRTGSLTYGVQAMAAARHEDEAKRRAEAGKKAGELLRENLTPKQRRALTRHGWFLVEGGKSGKLYRVEAGSYAGNIYELDEKKKPVARYCVHASPDIPLGDHLLTQALSLRFDEEHIIAKANKRREAL
jgi:hypothetical protein